MCISDRFLLLILFIGFTLGFYELNDKNFEENIIDKKNQLMVDLEKKCSLFLENYFNTLMTGKN